MQIEKFKQTDIVAIFLETGDSKELNSYGMTINRLEGSSLDGSMSQLYSRVITGDTTSYRPMTGSSNQGDSYLSGNQLIQRGKLEAVHYQVDSRLEPSNQWLWRASVTGTGLAGTVYDQNIGLATERVVQSNETYVPQYLDYHIW